MKSIEERALEIYPINNLYFESEYQLDSILVEGEDRNLKLREAYIKGATDQKSIDDEEYRKDMRYIGVTTEPNVEELAEKYAESCAKVNNLPIEIQHLVETAYIAGVNRV